MCFSNKSPTAQNNTPNYSVAQMGDQYEFSSKPAEEEAKAKKSKDDPEDLTM